MNTRFAKAGKDILKELLSQCSEGQQLTFRRMYSNDNFNLPINDAVDNMNDIYIDNAISQCERTVIKNQKCKSK